MVPDGRFLFPKDFQPLAGEYPIHGVLRTRVVHFFPPNQRVVQAVLPAKTVGRMPDGRRLPTPHKNLLNCSGIRSTSRSSPTPSVTAASPGLSQNCTTTSPRTATRSSHGSNSRARA